ncbi:MAG: hypothetical protein MJ252_14270 [archaeon]|nr:hypothetical protein [archaeon]
MSVIISAGKAISNSCCNHSKTKQMYSFSKAERFPKQKESTDKHTMYDLPSTKMTRVCNFGYGQRYDFTKAQKDNKADFCSFKSDFDKQHPHGPMYSFGVGRDKFTKVYVESNKNLDMNVPGPGKYYNPPAFGKGAISYSFRGRPEPNKEMVEKRKKMYPTPGPGEYPNVLSINPKGRYPLSYIENTSSVTLRADKAMQDKEKGGEKGDGKDKENQSKIN